MSADSPATRLPEALDAWRMVAARRGFEGVLPLAAMTRLRGSLVDAEGSVRVRIEFGRDALQVAYVELRIEAELPLECQRSLQRFLHPVALVQRLGLIRDEAEEAALPPGYEALLVPEDGMLQPAELVEDELILVVPVVPVAPGTEAVERDWPAGVAEQAAASPFAALAALKKQDSTNR
ncbi:YceD family protein [Vulcaniibacterium gelatinicum]|uniref:YceD family protein n=1 Tax=Vulcaniibacterium gelatinicum TaxID=2598725 RepID=UPI0011C9B664|nr:YceD family protein [Vulcaniibacterium gelatinicum]